MRIKHVMLAAAVAALASPSIAAARPATKKAPAKETKYCIQYEQTTGSRVRKAECLTKKEWAKRGVDLDQM